MDLQRIAEKAIFCYPLFMNQTLVTSYVGPDLDGFACAYAYTEFLNKIDKAADLGILGEPHSEVTFLLNRYQIPFIQKPINPEDYSSVVIVDASTLNGIDSRIKLDSVTEVIDHRKINEAEKFVNAKIQIEFVGAAASLVTEKFMDSGIQISRESATLLYGAIISNTLKLRANVTTERDVSAAKWLADIFQPSTDFAEEMFKAKSELHTENIAPRMRNEFAHINLGKEVGSVQLEIVNAERLVEELRSSMMVELQKLKVEHGLDYTFLTVIDLQNVRNIFLPLDDETEKFLTTALDLNFIEGMAVREGFIMRKELSPIFKKVIDNQKN
jgi:manganese-dependent inorganic pyrophosphatase